MFMTILLTSLLYYSLQVFQHVIIPISNYLQAKRLQIGLPLFILSDLILFTVAIAIYLNHKRSFRAVEVYDVRANPMLPPKSEGLELFRTQYCP
jgi:hypothetical protein